MSESAPIQPDTGSESASAAPAAPAVAPTPTPAAPPPAGDAAAAPDPLADLDPDQKVFNRSYVEAIRQEGARHRTERNELTERFAPLEPFVDLISSANESDRDAWHELMTDMSVDPVRAAGKFQNVAQAILEDAGLGAPQVTSTEPITPPAPGGDEPNADQMTQEQMRQFVTDELSKRDKERDQQSRVRAIFDKMDAAGYPAKSAKGQAVLWLANEKTGGDIDAAIAEYESELQGHTDGVIAAVQGQTPGVPAPDGGLAANEVPESPKTLDESKAKLQRRLAQQRTPGGV